MPVHLPSQKKTKFRGGGRIGEIKITDKNQVKMFQGGGLTKRKAGQILEEGQIGGRPLTDPQKRLFGFVKGGGRPTRLREMRGGGLVIMFGPPPEGLKEEKSPASGRRGKRK